MISRCFTDECVRLSPAFFAAEQSAEPEMLGRDNREAKNYRKLTIPTTFCMKPAEKYFDNPFEQAAYKYSRIKEIDDGAS